MGTNAPSQTVQVKKRGKPTAQVAWSVVQPTATWLSVSPTSGVNDGTLTLTFTTSALAVGQYQTSFRVQSTGSSITVNVQATIVSSAPPPLVANCPANQTVASPNAKSAVTASTMTAPARSTRAAQRKSTGTASTVTAMAEIDEGRPTEICGGRNASVYDQRLAASGSNFPVGTTTVPVTAQDSAQPQQTDTCNFTVTVTDSSTPPPPPSTGVGPQSTIHVPSHRASTFSLTDPLRSFNPWSMRIQARLRFASEPAHIILTARSRRRRATPLSASIGAILDGTGWTTTDDTQAAFRVYDDPNDPNDPNAPIDSVTIRNLVIRNMPH